MKKKFDMNEYLNDVSKLKKNQSTNTRTIQQVSVYDLEPNPANFYEINEIESLAAMIEIQGGVVTPLEVKGLKNGKYSIIAGHRRRAAVIYLLEKGSDKIKSPYVPAIVKTYVDHDAEIMALIFSNRGQRKRTADEISQEIKLLRPIAKRIYDEEKEKGNVSGRFRKFFAEDILQISETNLQRKMQLENLSNDVKKEIDNGSMTITAASELASLKPEKQVEILQQIKKDDNPITVKSVQSEKEKLKQLENEGQQKMFDNTEISSEKKDHDNPKGTIIKLKEKIVEEFNDVVAQIDYNFENNIEMEINEDLLYLERMIDHISLKIH